MINVKPAWSIKNVFGRRSLSISPAVLVRTTLKLTFDFERSVYRDSVLWIRSFEWSVIVEIGILNLNLNVNILANLNGRALLRFGKKLNWEITSEWQLTETADLTLVKIFLLWRLLLFLWSLCFFVLYPDL